jgi:uncharacterized membrane protein
MLTITLYMRQNCPLCERVEKDLQSLQAAFPHRLIRIDIEEEALAEFVDKIPVVEVGPYQLKAPIDKISLEMTLGAANDRLEQMDEIQLADHQKRLKKGKKVSFADQLFYWLSRRYMLVFNAFVLIYVGLAFLAPILQSQGKITPAKLIYTVYGRLCHQLSYRSWFLFGEQAAYPRAIADVDGLVTYGEATGFDPLDVKRAIAYLGDDQVGYKTALCQRDIGIYTGILLFGLVFSLTGRKIPGLPIGIWFVLGIVPIGLDGFSQIISQLPWGLIPIRESTPLLRSLTGGLFGFSTAWFGYPLVEESMADTRKVLAVKIKAAMAELVE